jgi:hypothetical protein
MDNALAAWLLHGREDAEGRTAADRRLLLEGSRLSRSERSLMSALTASWCSVFEVSEVRLGAGLELKDLILGDVLEVREQCLTAQVLPRDVIITWVLPAGDHLTLGSDAVLVPGPFSERLLADARRELARQPPDGSPEDHCQQAQRLAPQAFRQVPGTALEGRRRQVRRLAPRVFSRLLELFINEPLPPEAPAPEHPSSAPSLFELLDALPVVPRRRAFLDAAERRPRRTSGGKDDVLEPGSAYVFKLGPIDTTLDGRASIYVATTSDGEVMPPVMGRRDAEGLEALAPGLQGRQCYCEGRLARAGAAFGYASRPIPAALAKLRAVLAVQTFWGPEAPPDLAPELMEALLESCADLIRETPWELWTNEEVFTVHFEGDVKGSRELSVMGGGGSEYGFVLFDRPGSVERMALSGPPREGVDVLVPDSLGLTLEDEPSWVVKAVQPAFGLPFVPELMRFRRNRARGATVEEVLMAATAARALASAWPEEFETEVELHVGDLHVRARLEIPMPLFSGEYVGKALSQPRPRSAGASPPRRKVPTRKVSETLLEFAQPLVKDVESSEDPQDELFITLAFAMSIWNAVVQDTWEPEKGQVERIRATLRRMPRDDRERMTRDLALLVERKHRLFADDPRLFDALDVVVRRRGDLGVQLMGIVTPGAWPEFLGT